jgi:uncharacterized membrane protein YoaK (UPF0700 family)
LAARSFPAHHSSVSHVLPLAIDDPRAMKPSLPVLLSVNGGYVDTAGFLALQGLFTAHVTGNFVTLGAALVFGTSGVVNKLIALPVFCVAVALVRLLGYALAAQGVSQLRVLLGLKLALLVAGAVLAVRLGPFSNGDAWPALVTGMTLVAAMAVQNAVQRLHLGSAPPTTLMTGNTTQVVIDAVDLLRGAPDATTARGRLSRMTGNIAAFAIGCAAAALLFAFAGVWCFAVPPLIGLAAVLLRAEFPPLR